MEAAKNIALMDYTLYAKCVTWYYSNCCVQ